MPTPALEERFASLLRRPDAQIPLDEAALVIAAHAQVGLDIDEELVAIDELAAGVRDPTLTGVVRHLFRDLGFAGNTEAYYDPRNSFLNEVVRRRLGIPITLAIVMMEVARRHSVPLAGVGMPGHFLVRDKVDPSVFIDAFDRGRQLDAGGCARLFRRVHGSGARLDPSFLDPVDRATIITRVLGNLRSIYAQQGDGPSLAWVLRLRTHVPGAGPTELAELGEVLGAVGDLLGGAAAHDRSADLLDAQGADGAPAREAAARLRARLN
jgi:regulator of sirC expression with transglutaminase-like and TPR domain